MTRSKSPASYIHQKAAKPQSSLTAPTNKSSSFHPKIITFAVKINIQWWAWPCTKKIINTLMPVITWLSHDFFIICFYTYI